MAARRWQEACRAATRHTLFGLRHAIRRGVQTTLAEGLAFENELARAGVARFDKSAFWREAVIGRGQRQAC